MSWNKKQDKRRDKRKEEWNSTSIPSIGRFHKLAHQCKWGNHEPKIRKWKVAEWTRHWKVNQWKDDEISSRHESIEWAKSL